MMDQDRAQRDGTKPEFIQALMTALQQDIVSFAEFQQLARDTSGENISAASLADVLAVVLNAGIQVGQAFNETQDHVKFVAWGGSVNSRLARIERFLNETPEHERGFVVWFCLAAKVDEYEKVSE